MNGRRVCAVLVALAATCALVACGSGSASDGPPKLVIETSDPSPDRVAIDAPEKVDGGEVEIELRNRGDTLHDAQLFRVDGAHTGDEIVELLESSDSDAKPSWLHPSGGVAATPPGETASVTQVLAPGTYFVVDTQERETSSGVRLINGTKQGVSELAVARGGRGKLPDTPAAITAGKDGYDVSGIVGGPNSVTFRNAGDDLHQAVAVPVEPGASRRETLSGLLDVGWVPVAAPSSRATTVLESGDEQVTELRLQPGRYLLVCLVSARAGGPPQWRDGMISELEVPSESRP